MRALDRPYPVMVSVLPDRPLAQAAAHKDGNGPHRECRGCNPAMNDDAARLKSEWINVLDKHRSGSGRGSKRLLRDILCAARRALAVKAWNV